MAGVIEFFLNGKKLSSHMAHISEHISYSNIKVHSYDEMRKMVVNLGIKNCKINGTISCQITSLQN